MSSSILSTLLIKDYRLLIDIGCAPKEYHQPQIVSFDVLIQFAVLPLACNSDELSDSYCYQKITQLIAEISHAKHHKLIEHLAYTLFKSIKTTLKIEDKLALRIKKLNPPIEGLQGGATFCCGDESMVLTW